MFMRSLIWWFPRTRGDRPKDDDADDDAEMVPPHARG